MGIAADFLQKGQEALQALGLPERYIMNAIMWAGSKLNMTPIDHMGSFEAPYTRLTGKPPFADCLQPFGCLVEYKSLSGAKEQGLFLGVDMGQMGELDPNGYKVLDLKTKQEKKVDAVEFFPTKFPMRDGA